MGLEGLLQVHHGGGGQVTPDESCCASIWQFGNWEFLPDNLIPSRVELISAGRPHLEQSDDYLCKSMEALPYPTIQLAR